ncbi:hypothetical protein Solca_1680 [Solitalea canadensis DSM 3403]|uniref:YtxH-like protein n=2 Tax=Solitalea canadensis TaxID=995 RepID=H8KQK8_SOLCM|nr:hypothetical protein Solca_1680 [Solitalea canadensis DSM 3403]
MVNSFGIIFPLSSVNNSIVMKDTKSIMTLFAGIAVGATIGVFVVSKISKEQFKYFKVQLRDTRKRIVKSFKNKFRKEELKRMGKQTVVDPTL